MFRGDVRLGGLLMLLAGIGFVISLTSHHARTRVELVLESPADGALGLLPMQATTIRPVRLRNDSPMPVHVTRLLAACACTTVAPQQFTIGPRESQTIELAIQPVLLHNPDNLPAVSDLQIRLMAIVAAPQRQRIELPTLYGKVHSPLRSCPRRVRLEAVAGPEPGPVSGVFDVVAHQPLRALQVTASDSEVMVKAEPLPSDAASYAVHVSRLFPVPETKELELNLVPVLPNAEHAPAYTTRVTLTQHPDVQCLPPFLNFSELTVGTPSTLTLDLRSHSASPFSLLRTELKPGETLSDQARIQVRTLYDTTGGSGRLSVTVEPFSAGPWQGSILCHIEQWTHTYAIEVPLLMNIR